MSKFCIIEKDHNLDRRVISYTDSIDGFLGFVEDAAKKKFGQVTVLKNFTGPLETIKDDTNYLDGHYVVQDSSVNNSVIRLVKKVTDVEIGFLLNRYNPTIKTILKWRLLSVDESLLHKDEHITHKNINVKDIKQLYDIKPYPKILILYSVLEDGELLHKFITDSGSNIDNTIITRLESYSTNGINYLEFDYIFLLKTEFYGNLKPIYTHYKTLFPDSDGFIQIFNTLTEDNGCMVLINALKGSNTGVLDRVNRYTIGGSLEFIKDISLFQLEKFDIQSVNIRKDAKMLIVGDCIRLRDTLVSFYNGYDRIFVNNSQIMFSNKIDKVINRYIKYTQYNLNSLRYTQSAQLKNLKTKDDSTCDQLRKVFFIDRMDYARDTSIIDLINTSKLYFFTIVSCIQGSYNLKPDIVSKFDYIIIDPKICNESIYNQYLKGVVSDLDKYRTLVKSLNDDKKCLVIEKSTNTIKFYDNDKVKSK